MPTPPRPARRRTTAWLVLLFVALATPPDARAAEVPKHYYRDPVHKFSFKIFDGWAQVPLEADEKVQVAKFMEEGSSQWITPEMLVVRVDKREGASEPVVTGEGETPEWLREAMERNRPKSAWDAVFGRMMIPDEARPDPEDFEKVRSKDRVDGRLWTFQYAMGGSRDSTYFFTLAVFAKDEVEYGLLMSCSLLQQRKYERGFELVAKSFSFFDEKAGEVETLDVLEGVNISPARRRAIERSMVKGWDVIVSSKRNYIVVYNTKNNRNHQLAREIAKRIEMIREQVYEVQFPPAKSIDAVSIVRVCGDQAEYFAYGGPGGSAGYWNSGSEELVFYDASPSRKIDDDTVAVLYHEAFHQYIYYSVGNVAPHSWFNEGHGDYYAGAKIVGRSFRIGPFAWRRDVIKGAVAHGPRISTEETDLETGQTRTRWAADGGYTPLKDFVRFTQGEYYSYPSICYAQGWSLIYFLREVVPKNRKYQEKWGHILSTYFDVLKEEVNRETPLLPGQGADPEGPAIPDGGDDEGTEPPVTPGDGTPGGEEPGDGSPGGEEPGAPDPGDGDPGDGEPGGEEPEDPGAFLPPPVFFRGLGSDAALERAVDKAFEGVDWAEFEEAWAKSVKRDM